MAIVTHKGVKLYDGGADLEQFKKELLDEVNQIVSASGGIVDGEIISESSWWFRTGGKLPLLYQGGTARTSEGTSYLTFPKPYKSTPFWAAGEEMSGKRGSAHADNVQLYELSPTGCRTCTNDDSCTFRYMVIGKYEE